MLSSVDAKCYKKRWDDGRGWELVIVSPWRGGSYAGNVAFQLLITVRKYCWRRGRDQASRLLSEANCKVQIQAASWGSLEARIRIGLTRCALGGTLRSFEQSLTNDVFGKWFRDLCRGEPILHWKSKPRKCGTVLYTQNTCLFFLKKGGRSVFPLLYTIFTND